MPLPNCMVGLVSPCLSPSGSGVLYPSMRFPDPALFGSSAPPPPPSRLSSPRHCQPASPLLPSLERLIVLDNTLPACLAGPPPLPSPPPGLPYPSLHHTCGPGLCCYIRQPDHGIRSSNYAGPHRLGKVTRVSTPQLRNSPCLARGESLMCFNLWMKRAVLKVPSSLVSRPPFPRPSSLPPPSSHHSGTPLPVHTPPPYPPPPPYTALPLPPPHDASTR